MSWWLLPVSQLQWMMVTSFLFVCVCLLGGRRGKRRMGHGEWWNRGSTDEVVGAGAQPRQHAEHAEEGQLPVEIQSRLLAGRITQRAQPILFPGTGTQHLPGRTRLIWNTNKLAEPPGDDSSQDDWSSFDVVLLSSSLILLSLLLLSWLLLLSIFVFVYFLSFYFFWVFFWFFFVVISAFVMLENIKKIRRRDNALSIHQM